MLRRFLNWLIRPSGPPRSRGRRGWRTGCLLWLLIVIALLVILSLFFGSYQKGTRATGMAPPLPSPPGSAHTRMYPADRVPIPSRRVTPAAAEMQAHADERVILTG